MAKTYATPNAITAKSTKNTQNKGSIELWVISNTEKYMQGWNVAESKKKHEEAMKKFTKKQKI